MNKFKKIILVSVAFLGIFLVNANSHKYKPMKMYKKLDLSETQKQQIKEIFKKDISNKVDMSKKYNDFRKKMRKLTTAETLDLVAVEKIADESSIKMKEHIVSQAKKEHAAWQILTPEQREKANKRFEKKVEKAEKKIKEKIEEAKEKKEEAKEKMKR